MRLTTHRTEQGSDGVHLVIDGQLSGPYLRALAAPPMAHLVGSASRICRLGLEGEARLWQDVAAL